MTDEIELKITLAPDALKRLQRHPLLRSLAAGRRLRKAALQSIYYDTPDRKLAARKIAFRVRSEGRRFLQTVKRPKACDLSGLQEVSEEESELPSAAPDPARVIEPTAASVLAQPGVSEALAPVFETQVERYALPIRLIDSEVEIAFDLGRILAKGKESQPICEAEFELKSGRPERLVQLALTLHENVDFRLLSESKAARGYALADGREPQPFAAERVELPETLTAGEALVAVARACFTQVQANERAVLAGSTDPEAMHQFRVAVRRLRAALGVFRPIVAEPVLSALLDDLEWLQSGTGAARDWDVFCLETLAPMLHRLPDESALQHLAERAEQSRQAARAEALAVLQDRRYTTLMLRIVLLIQDSAWRKAIEPGELIAAADEPGRVFAQRQLAKRSRALLKLGRQRDESDPASLHQLRIGCKKLRYAIEFFRTFLAKGTAKAALEALKELQDCLGSLNDAAVGQQLLEQAGETSSRPEEARALGLLAGWQASRIDQDLRHLKRAWKHARRSLAPLTEG
jgi:inorganic triphosphatase YgiF